MKRAAAIALAIAALAAAPSSAFADASEGEWCSSKGPNVMFTGPQIRLSTGQTIAGNYRRHEFAYQIPAGEENAGSIVYLQLISEEEMLFRLIQGDT